VSRSPSRLRNERFVSYLSANNSKRVNTDLQDAFLASRRLARQVLVLAGIGGLIWIVVESAQAVGVF
jgi:hypothetical protein